MISDNATVHLSLNDVLGSNEKESNREKIFKEYENSKQASKISMSRRNFVLFLLFSSLVFLSAGFFGAKIWDLEGGNENEFASKLTVLSEAINRVEMAEQQLRSRAIFLDSLIDDTVQLDRQQFDVPYKVDELVPIKERLAIGGEGEYNPILVNGPAWNVLDEGIFSNQGNLFISDIDDYLEKFRHFPIGSPVEGKITSLFGRRWHPILGKYQDHKGLDIAIVKKTIVESVGDGIVVLANEKGSYGKTIAIDHGNGMETLYGHLDRIDVSKGQKVCRGQQIGLIGTTGRTTGPHLHYEVILHGIRKNPRSFIKLAGFLRIMR